MARGGLGLGGILWECLEWRDEEGDEEVEGEEKIDEEDVE